MSDSTDEPAPEARSAGYVVVDDPSAIKAMAHPARLAILDYLTSHDSATATECARVAGLSPSATSYHLRALAKWGLVREAGSKGDARERRWESVGRGYTTTAGVGAPGGVGAAQQFMVRHTQSRTDAEMERWLAAAPSEPVEWQEASVISRTRITVTAAEMKQLSEQILEVFDTYRRSQRAGHEPEGSRTVLVNFRMFPLLHPDD